MATNNLKSISRQGSGQVQGVLRRRVVVKVFVLGLLGVSVVFGLGV